MRPGFAEGTQLKRGDLVGYVGSTGNASPDAPHLHFAIFVLGPEKHWWEGTAINPYPLLVAAPATGVALIPGRSLGLYSDLVSGQAAEEPSMDNAGVSWGTIAGVGIVLYLLYVAIGGLIIGALARWLLPGPDPMSYPRTILYGLGGSLAGGIVGWLLGLPAWLDLGLSVAGAAGLIWYFRRRTVPPAA